MAEQFNGGKQLILGLVFVTVLGALGGSGAAYFLSGSMAAPQVAVAEQGDAHADTKPSDSEGHGSGDSGEAPGEGETASGDHGETSSAVATLPPIITNIASPRDVWMRLEAAILLKEGSLSSEETSQVATDVMSFLRTLAIDQIEGASAFQHLREDLLDRVNIRLEGRATEFLIFGMVVE